MKNWESIALSNKEYAKKNKHKIKSYIKAKLAKDINFKIATNLRKRTGNALQRISKSGSAVRDLGCTIPELKFYLEGNFKDGMTWENYGRKGWVIDHAIPLAFFDLTDREQFLKACHYTNLQPLWATENNKKGKSLSTPQASPALAGLGGVQ